MKHSVQIDVELETPYIQLQSYFNPSLHKRNDVMVSRRNEKVFL